MPDGDESNKYVTFKDCMASMTGIATGISNLKERMVKVETRTAAIMIAFTTVNIIVTAALNYWTRGSP